LHTVGAATEKGRIGLATANRARTSAFVQVKRCKHT